VNIKGGPAMPIQEFLSWRQKTILGASLKIVAPTGQYDPTKLVTPGTNRWAFKPELGLSRRWDNWIFDAYGGVWFFTGNSEFFSQNRLSPGTNTLSQAPMGSIEMHLSYDFRPLNSATAAALWSVLCWGKLSKRVGCVAICLAGQT
jgi:Putative MetA-pathway of phenol degradation